jgi:hypothetical protein
MRAAGYLAATSASLDPSNAPLFQTVHSASVVDMRGAVAS